MVLQDAVERKIHYSTKDKISYYADLPMPGLYVVRGDAMVLMGSVGDDDKDADEARKMKRLEMEELDNMIQDEKDSKEAPASTTAPPAQPTELEWDFDKDLLA